MSALTLNWNLISPGLISLAAGREMTDGRRIGLAVGIVSPVRQQVILPVWLEPAQFAGVPIGLVIQVPQPGQVRTPGGACCSGSGDRGCSACPGILSGGDVLPGPGCQRGRCQPVVAFQAPGIVAGIALRALQEDVAVGICRWDQRQVEQGQQIRASRKFSRTSLATEILPHILRGNRISTNSAMSASERRRYETGDYPPYRSKGKRASTR